MDHSDSRRILLILSEIQSSSSSSFFITIYHILET